MATKTFEELIAGAQTIKTNQLPESNTADLVGEQLVQMTEKMEYESRASRTELEKKFDKSSVKQELGTSETDVVSQAMFTKAMSEYNASVLWPTLGYKSDGTLGGDLYDFSFALTTTIAQVGAAQIKQGMVLGFKDKNNAGLTARWEFLGGTVTTAANWKRLSVDRFFDIGALNNNEPISASDARNMVPTANRILGLTIRYCIGQGSYIEEQYIGDTSYSASTWNRNCNWKTLSHPATYPTTPVNIFSRRDHVRYGFGLNNASGGLYGDAYALITVPINEETEYTIAGLAGVLHTSFSALHYFNNGSIVSRAATPTYLRELNDRSYTFISPVGCNTLSFTINNNEKVLDAPIMIVEGPSIGDYSAHRYSEYPDREELRNIVDHHYFVRSTKNLLNLRNIITNRRILNNSTQATGNANDVITQPQLLAAGSYVLSGVAEHGGGLAAITNESGVFSSILSVDVNGSFTLTESSYVIVQICKVTGGGTGDLTKIFTYEAQLEVGLIHTEYEPYLIPKYIVGGQSEGGGTSKNIVTEETVEFNGGSVYSNFVAKKVFEKRVGAKGVMYNLSSSDNNVVANTLYQKIDGLDAGEYSLCTYLDVHSGGTRNVPKLDVYKFDIPSGCLDNPDKPSGYDNRYPLANYCHPSIAYDANGVGGYKYWMIASAYPLAGGDAEWEDEDIFVSNDAVTWLRIRSLYEDAKSYTQASMTLPPHNFTDSGRRHCFIPVPGIGKTVEVSTPSFDRVQFTIESNPWKHDPCILIDGGYVYMYTSFHLGINGETAGKHRFIVLTRTNNGIDWEVVRSDGSTMALTSAEVTATIFTKDSQGRYNYLHYMYSLSKSNPEIIKWGDGDYEFVYGYNFSEKYKGTTPWNIDFANTYPFASISSGNHPGLVRNGDDLYLVDSSGVHKSTNRGASFTTMPYKPLWCGGVQGTSYKKALCVGAGGSVIAVDTYRANNLTLSTSETDGHWVYNHYYHNMIMMKFASIEAFVNAVESTGINDSYLDVQCEIVSKNVNRSTSVFIPYSGLKSTTTHVNTPSQKRVLGTITVASGDVVNMYSTALCNGNSSMSFCRIVLEKNS